MLSRAGLLRAPGGSGLVRRGRCGPQAPWSLSLRSPSLLREPGAWAAAAAARPASRAYTKRVRVRKTAAVAGVVKATPAEAARPSRDVDNLNIEELDRYELVAILKEKGAAVDESLREVALREQLISMLLENSCKASARPEANFYVVDGSVHIPVPRIAIAVPTYLSQLEKETIALVPAWEYENDSPGAKDSWRSACRLKLIDPLNECERVAEYFQRQRAGDAFSGDDVVKFLDAVLCAHLLGVDGFDLVDQGQYEHAELSGRFEAGVIFADTPIYLGWKPDVAKMRHLEEEEIETMQEAIEFVRERIGFNAALPPP